MAGLIASLVVLAVVLAMAVVWSHRKDVRNRTAKEGEPA